MQNFAEKKTEDKLQVCLQHTIYAKIKKKGMQKNTGAFCTGIDFRQKKICLFLYFQAFPGYTLARLASLLPLREAVLTADLTRYSSSVI